MSVRGLDSALARVRDEIDRMRANGIWPRYYAQVTQEEIKEAVRIAATAVRHVLDLEGWGRTAAPRPRAGEQRERRRQRPSAGEGRRGGAP